MARKAALITEDQKAQIVQLLTRIYGKEVKFKKTNNAFAYEAHEWKSLVEGKKYYVQLYFYNDGSIVLWLEDGPIHRRLDVQTKSYSVICKKLNAWAMACVKTVEKRVQAEMRQKDKFCAIQNFTTNTLIDNLK